jgi:hypothetical protein
MADQSTRPTRAGQMVTNGTQVGITTDSPRVRTPQIAVQWIGGPYPVLESIEDVTLTA